MKNVVETVLHWIWKSKYLKETLIWMSALLMFACGNQNNYQSKDQLQALWLQQLWSHSFVTKNGYWDKQKLGSLTIASDKSFSVLLNSLRNKNKEDLKNRYWININQWDKWEIILTNNEWDSVKYFISKEGFVFFDGGNKQAEDMFYKIIEIKQSYTPLKFDKKIEK